MRIRLIVLRNYNYEVLMFIKGYSNSSSGSTYGYVYTSDDSFEFDTSMAVINVSTNARNSTSYCTMPIPNNKKLYFKITTTKAGNTAVTAIRYRRIGTNS